MNLDFEEEEFYKANIVGVVGEYKREKIGFRTCTFRPFSSTQMLISKETSDLELVTTVLIGTILLLLQLEPSRPHRFQSLIQSRHEHNFGANESLEVEDILRAM